MTGTVLASSMYSVFGAIGPFAVMGILALAMVVLVIGINWWVRHQHSRQTRPDTRKNTLEGHAAYRRYVVAATWSGGTARDWDHSVRPVLGELVELAMAELEPSGDPRETARERLGPRLWPLVNRDAGRSDDRGTSGAGHQTLLRILDQVELDPRDFDPVDIDPVHSDPRESGR